ncbi:hypothetical protein [Streptomyces katrae]|uniref:hypothetical protein n=1 Tax=Streptomyces katrae TaxID=68223 RepID=UPI0004BEF423|nr:hypothetical protein [Streptomyces katrae]
MSLTSRTLRLALLTASTSLAAGGVLLPTGAFAAPATPHAITLPADRGSDDHKDRRGEDGKNDKVGSDENPAGEGEVPSKPADSESGVVPESYCNDPKAAPGLCVNGKPLPKGDGTVKVPMGSQLCLGVDTPEQCAARQPKPPVPGGTGSSTIELAV